MIVVDTNIIAYYCLPGPRSELADQLWQQDIEWAAPILWRSEMRNILAGYLRRGAITSSEANEVMMVAAEALKGGEHMVADEVVLKLVTTSTCSAYDCEFAALAQSLGVPLVTEDKQLRTAFPRTSWSLKGFLQR
jgi:predicted nucleic acid-binding protein